MRRSCSTVNKRKETGPKRTEDEVVEVNGIDIDVYGDLHRYVLQGIIQAGFLDSRGVRHLFNGACDEMNFCLEDEQPRMPLIQKVVQKINQQINKFNMAIKSITCEITEAKYYVFMLLFDTPIAQFQKKFTKVEMDMFQSCMDVILRKSATFSLSEEDCIGAALEVDRNSKKLNSGEEFVAKMLTMLYFIKFANPKKSLPDQITLGPRAIRELDLFLTEMYPDIIIKCSLCQTSLLHGLKCPGTCGCFVHRGCHKKYVSSSTECPKCRTSWESVRMIRRVKVVEEADTDTEIEMEEEAT